MEAAGEEILARWRRRSLLKAHLVPARFAMLKGRESGALYQNTFPAFPTALCSFPDETPLPNFVLLWACRFECMLQISRLTPRRVTGHGDQAGADIGVELDGLLAVGDGDDMISFGLPGNATVGIGIGRPGLLIVRA